MMANVYRVSATCHALYEMLCKSHLFPLLTAALSDKGPCYPILLTRELRLRDSNIPIATNLSSM